MDTQVLGVKIDVPGWGVISPIKKLALLRRCRTQRNVHAGRLIMYLPLALLRLPLCFTGRGRAVGRNVPAPGTRKRELS